MFWTLVVPSIVLPCATALCCLVASIAFLTTSDIPQVEPAAGFWLMVVSSVVLLSVFLVVLYLYMRGMREERAIARELGLETAEAHFNVRDGRPEGQSLLSASSHLLP